ncbi:MAG TPA: N-methyl-L-tryptophan oxidase [Actinomycetota bacterium]|nr:N-methyl-L-tryptophan oxidase [Actinomycetota bacterium]
MERVDHVVIGAGIMGSATARSLARAGRSVVLLERFRFGHKRGSSHGRTRIFRLSYPDPTYVEMAKRSRDLWRELENEMDQSLLDMRGGLDLGPNIEHNAAALERNGAPLERMNGKAATERFPGVEIPDDERVLFQPESAVISAEGALAAFIASAMNNGAQALEEREVIRIRPESDGVRVDTAGGDFTARTIVVTVGPWVQKVLAPLGIEIPVRPTRETVSYFDVDTEGLPTIVEWGDPTLYALPSPGQGLKAAEHIAGAVADPDDSGGVDRDSIARVQEWVKRRFPAADPEPRHSETCFYTNTSDEHFVLERRDKIVIGSPCSGHGFKFAPLIGERLAAMAMEER